MLGVDPGSQKSGWCLLQDGVPVAWGWDENTPLRDRMADHDDLAEYDHCLHCAELVIEDVSHYGMPVGKDVFSTVKWIGRFDPYETAALIPRGDVLLALCGRRKGANDSTVRQALIDRYGGDAVAVGGKKCRACKGKGWIGHGRPACPLCREVIGDAHGTGYETPPGPLKGITGHVFSALAVAVTYLDQQVDG